MDTQGKPEQRGLKCSSWRRGVLVGERWEQGDCCSTLTKKKETP